VVSNAKRRTLQLPDGTQVWLNAGSKLVYREDFGKEKRNVWLEGEAFFEVAADQLHPFIVNTDRITVRVLGTAFNVRAYRNDHDVEASLVRGKISVSLKDDPEKSIILSPREKFVVNKGNISTTPALPRINAVKYQVQALAYEGKDSSLLVETAWVSNKLAFTNQPFEEVARQMERWYDVRIHFENDSLKGILMSGIFDKETIEQALGVLQLMVKFKYTVNGRDINIGN
jgi:ferric-dicitrate binding protein FerR (iron transport regulator)